MNPKPMRNDSDRVSPDRRIRLPGRTPVRSRRRIAAGVLSVLLGLSCFAASPAWAYKAGPGADDTPIPPEFANVAAYLAAVPGSHVHGDVKIGRYILKREDLDAFHKAHTLTQAKLIASFADTAAYLADPGRTNRLYAYIGNKVYRVTELEAARDRNTNTIPTLPSPVERDSGGTNTAVGVYARASEHYATAIGADSKATNRGTVSIGMDSRASGWKSVAIGAEADAQNGIAIGRNTQGFGAVVLGQRANAHGDGAVALGNNATALGDGSTAVGTRAMTVTESGLSMNNLNRFYLNRFLRCIYRGGFTDDPCRSFLTPAQLADPRFTAKTDAGKAFRDGIQRQLIFVLNGLSAPAATALGSDSRATARDSTALGYSSWAAGIWGSTAVGSTSRATGNQSTALGAEAKAGGSHSTAVGEGSEAHGADTVAVGGGAVAGGLSSDKTYDDVAKYLADPTRTGSTNVQIGKKVYGVTALEAVTGLTKDNLPVALTATAGGVAVGVSAAAAGLDSIALGRSASATGTNGIAIGQGVSAGQNEVVVGASTHSYKLPGLATTSGTQVVTVDSNGRLSTQAATSSSSRGASLRGAAALSAEVTALNRDTGTATEAVDYEEAPAIGSGPGAPATAEQRRVVVQDTNRDGSVRLRTLDFGDLSGVDRRLSGVEQRVTTLSERLNKATAMTAALSALPNVVPGDKRFFLGVGAGHYSSEQAVAIGMSARVGRHVFVNAGAAVASGDNASVRGGVGVVW